ncbi:Imm50 family immunity protein [Herbaspirillum chlorophenolicum]|uniref:Imm50 family immunity protein n=1 Tax=Herbaspirillum chlorophenolicum TaxID=211589 RepID=UPI00067C497E|nr:Imm50 family immunity protein [Herbaspirillum chlorophenolicum]
MRILDFIDGSEKLIAELGEWPSFHDDEIVTVFLKREAGLGSEENTSMRLSIHVRRHEEIGLGTAQYHLRMNKNILVHLVFRNIQDLAISNFNGQNVIHSLDITEYSLSNTPEARVSLESSWGLEGTFRCKSIQVESIEMLPIA